MNEGKFYLIEITRYVDNTPEAKGVYTYESENDAIANFHSKMGGAMKNTNYAFELCHVINEYGVVVRSETFERPVEE